jgi:hypothetical protein
MRLACAPKIPSSRESMPLAMSACKITFRAAAAAIQSSADKSTRRHAKLQLCNISMRPANLITLNGALCTTSCRWLDAVGLSWSPQVAVLIHSALRQWEERYHDFSSTRAPTPTAHCGGFGRRRSCYPSMSHNLILGTVAGQIGSMNGGIP